MRERKAQSASGQPPPEAPVSDQLFIAIMSFLAAAGSLIAQLAH
jgi:hypothetical protein